MKLFYISAIDGSKKYLIDGPFFNHEDALNEVSSARKIACKRNVRASFMAFGTMSISDRLPIITPLMKERYQNV